jgi:DNA-binding protein
MSETNTVLIGKKPVMNYVLACLTLLQNGASLVTLKARGRAISKAVDTAQILMKRFATDVKVKRIEIDTEQVKNTETGNLSNVSSILIEVGK